MTSDIVFALSIVLIVLVCLNTKTYTPKVNYALFMAIQWLSGGLSWLGNRSEERRVGKEC